MIETRNGSGLVLKQHVGGTGYIDELVQVPVNSDPVGDDLCDVRYWARAEANFNVLGSSLPPGCCASGANTRHDAVFRKFARGRSAGRSSHRIIASAPGAFYSRARR
jgi:hypothetical protein